MSAFSKTKGSAQASGGSGRACCFKTRLCLIPRAALKNVLGVCSLAPCQGKTSHPESALSVRVSIKPCSAGPQSRHSGCRGQGRPAEAHRRGRTSGKPSVICVLLLQTRSHSQSACNHRAQRTAPAIALQLPGLTCKLSSPEKPGLFRRPWNFCRRGEERSGARGKPEAEFPSPGTQGARDVTGGSGDRD